MEFDYMNQTASVVDGGIMFGEMSVHPTRGLNTETASSYGGPLSANMSVLQSEVSSFTNSPVSENLDSHQNYFPLDQSQPKVELSDSIEDQEELFKHARHFFILSSAGKPIYSMHGSQELLIVYSGIIQTIVSFYEFSSIESENVKSVDAEDEEGNPIKLVFLNKSPILFLAISTDITTSKVMLIQQLDFIHNFLLATLSKPFIDKTFHKRANFDLRQVLGPTDIVTLDSICMGLANNTNMDQVFGGLECLKMKQSIRARLERKMLEHKSENLLYALAVGPNGKLIDIMRPKRHTLHTSDLSLLFEMIYNTNAFKSPRSKSKDTEVELNGTITSVFKDKSSEVTERVNRAGPLTAERSVSIKNELKLTVNETFWLPLCLPKFNPTGHLYTLIQFHQMNDPRLFELHDVSPPNLDDANMSVNEAIDEDESKIAIIIITPYKDSFDEMKKVATGIAKSILFDKNIWYDIWKSMLGSNRIIFEDVMRSIGKEKKVKEKPPLAVDTIDSSVRERRNTFVSIKSLFGANASVKRPPTVPVSLSNSRNSLFSLNLSSPPLLEHQIVHFILKNRKLTQFIYPQSREFNVQDQIIKMKLMKVYNEIRKSLIGQQRTQLKSIQWKTERNNLTGLGVIINGYEVYILSEGNSSENKLIEIAIKLIKWVKKEEHRLFISSGCTF